MTIINLSKINFMMFLFVIIIMLIPTFNLAQTNEKFDIDTKAEELGITTRWHLLKETSERYYILSGSGSVEVGNLPAQEVLPGDVVLIPPDCRQRITNIGKEDLIFHVICSPRFTVDAYEDLEEKLK